jgi:hypothetical protein
MAYLHPEESHTHGAANRAMVVGLFVSTCLLSVVSWYTTYQGMVLYLSPWFAFLASLGVQSALVLVAWLIGLTRTGRPLLIAVYTMTAVVSIAFSYVSLYTWFSSRERPALVERKLYDSINSSSGQTVGLLSAAIAETQKHALALDEMTAAERSHGYISRAQDADPYLARIREAVATEAQTYSTGYKEGSGEGLRYTAFDRYSKMTRQSLERLQAAQRDLSDFRAQLKPLDPSEVQIRKYREVYDAVPWTEVEQAIHSGRMEKPPVPSYGENIDRSVTGQEDLLLAFTELATNPAGRPVFSLLLAAFIDIIVFLLAYAAGPQFAGLPEHRWSAAGAAIDGENQQVFLRGILRKMEPDPRGMARIDVSTLSPGELQLCMLLASGGSAVLGTEDSKGYYLIDEATHQQLVQSLATGSIYLRATQKVAPAAS